jgi:hypothetical protein
MATISASPDAVKAPRHDRCNRAAGKPLGPTPLRAFIRGECANAQPDDGCLLRADGCLVVRGQRCRYFEAAILPLLTRCSSARCLKLYPDAADAYLRLHRELSGVLNPDPTRFCACGEPLGKRRRLCDACAKTRRREAYRRAKAGNGARRPQLTGKSTLIPSETRAVLASPAETRGIGQGTLAAVVNCCAPMPGAAGIVKERRHDNGRA